MHQHLTEQLKTALSPTHLEVIDESHNHSGTATESHFKLVVASNYFTGLQLINRHRFIHKLFKDELNNIHALALHTYTPDEWKEKSRAPKSHKCTGSKKLESNNHFVKLE